MGRNIGPAMITTSVRISPEFHQLCLKHFISFSEAIRVGISLILAEKGVKEYDNSLNLFRKMSAFRLELEKLSQEVAEKRE